MPTNYQSNPIACQFVQMYKASVLSKLHLWRSKFDSSTYYDDKFSACCVELLNRIFNIRAIMTILQNKNLFKLKKVNQGSDILYIFNIDAGNKLVLMRSTCGRTCGVRGLWGRTCGFRGHWGRTCGVKGHWGRIWGVMHMTIGMAWNLLLYIFKRKWLIYEVNHI